MKKIVIDTNAYSHFLTGDQDVLNVLAKAELIYMSIFVLAELYTGFKYGSKEKQNRKWLETFLEKPTVHILDTCIETAEIFSEIKHDLKKAGKQIPIHDVWIAAHAMETGSVLISYDRHFSSVPGLRTWNGIK